jgi:hypothetical protein
MFSLLCMLLWVVARTVLHLSDIQSNTSRAHRTASCTTILTGAVAQFSVFIVCTSVPGLVHECVLRDRQPKLRVLTRTTTATIHIMLLYMSYYQCLDCRRASARALAAAIALPLLSLLLLVALLLLLLTTV